MSYIRTDLACEFSIKNGKDFHENVSVHLISDEIFPVFETLIKKDIGEYKLGKYRTLCIGKAYLYNDEYVSKVKHVLAESIKNIVFSKSKKFERILIAGLGNRHLITDAIGPLTIENLNMSPQLCNSKIQLAFISPGIYEQSGIQSADFVKSIATDFNAECVILIDALSARSVDRLCSTIQISNIGLTPGSGVGSLKKAIDKEFLGIPVFSIGVPTVVSSSTMIYDAINNAGLKKIPNELVKILENGKSFFVTPKESDIIISSLAKILADSIHMVIF